MTKIKRAYQQHKLISVVGVIAIIIIAALLIINVVNKHKKLDVSEYLDTSFAGYNTQGTASIPDDASRLIMTKAFYQIAEKQGFKQDIIGALMNADSDDDAAALVSQQDLPKLKIVQSQMQALKLSLSKDTQLTNGDKVTASLKVTDPSVPIKPATKTFTVKGLKQPQFITAKGIAKKNLSFKYKGFDGRGEMVIVGTDDLVGANIKVKHNGQLSNGETVKLTLSADITNPQTEGIIFKGPKTFTTTVRGLPDPKKITNTDEVLRQFNEEAKSEYANDNEFNDETYKIEFQNLWLTDHTASVANYNYEDHATNVEVISKSDYEASNPGHDLSAFAVYKLTTTAKESGRHVTEIAIGYDGLAIIDNKLNISTKGTDDLTSETFNDARSISYDTIKNHLTPSGVILK